MPTLAIRVRLAISVTAMAEAAFPTTTLLIAHLGRQDVKVRQSVELHQSRGDPI